MVIILAFNQGYPTISIKDGPLITSNTEYTLIDNAYTNSKPNILDFYTLTYNVDADMADGWLFVPKNIAKLFFEIDGNKLVW